MRRIQNFKFKDVVLVLGVFVLIALILFIELSGVNALRYKRQPELLPDHAIVTKAEAIGTLEKTTLILHDSGNESSRLAYEQFIYILNDMKVGHNDVDI